MKFFPWLPAVLFFTSVQAQVPALPTDSEVDAALRGLAPTIDRVLKAQPAAPQKTEVAPVRGVVLPDVIAKPQSVPQPPKPGSSVIRRDSKVGDIPSHLRMPSPVQPNFEKLIQKYEGAVKPEAFGTPKFYLFASFSIPPEALRKILTFASEYGATVVFRGGLDDKDISMQRLMRKVLSLKIRPMPSVMVHPPLFTRYKVTAAPTWVLAMPESAEIDAAGCAPAGTYGMVTGDVTAEYALELFSRRGQGGVAASARGLLTAARGRS